MYKKKTADGKLFSPLFLVLQETNGKLGSLVQKTLFRPANIYVTVSKSRKLTSDIVCRSFLIDYFLQIPIGNWPNMASPQESNLTVYRTWDAAHYSNKSKNMFLF